MSENPENSASATAEPTIDLTVRPSILLESRLNAASRSSVLRPSAFGSRLGATTAQLTDEPKDEILDDPKVNPFLKDGANGKKTEREENDKPKDDVKDNGTEVNDNITKGDEKSDPLSLLCKNGGLVKSNLFANAKSSIPLVENSGFVFGQNVHERVIGENIQSTSVENSKIDCDHTSNQSENSASNLFSSVVPQKLASTADKTEETSEKSLNQNESKSLTDVAREYEESRTQKRKYEEVETFTGEENEENVVDFNCKLFAFINANWEERGRGALRLNDSKDPKGCSRVVFRTSGNLRLLLNTKIWPGMVAERPSPKSLRLTAMDNTGTIKVFLVMSRPEDISVLFKALTDRIYAQKAKNYSSIDDDDDDLQFNDDDNGVGKEIENDRNDEPSPPKKTIIESN